MGALDSNNAAMAELQGIVMRLAKEVSELKDRCDQTDCELYHRIRKIEDDIRGTQQNLQHIEDDVHDLQFDVNHSFESLLGSLR